MRLQWKRIGQLAGMVTPAGPVTSEPVANAAVLRVRRASDWASTRAPRFSLLATASAEPPLVVDRVGLTHALIGTVSRAQTDPTLGAKFGQALALARSTRQLSEFLPLSWLFENGRVRRLLVAPNIWETATTRRLDQDDYARLVAARGLLWDSLFGASPWLADRLLSQLVASPESRGNSVQVAVLFHRLVESQLERFTPRTIPSINWLRDKDPLTFLRMLKIISGASMLELADLSDRMQHFVREADFSGHPRAFWALLQDPTNFPTEHELEDPSLWRGRLGYG